MTWSRKIPDLTLGTGEVVGGYLWTYGGEGGWLHKEAMIRLATLSAFGALRDAGMPIEGALRIAAKMGQVTEARVLSTHHLTFGLKGGALIHALTAHHGEVLNCEIAKHVDA